MPTNKQKVKFAFTFIVLFSIVPLTHNLMFKESVSWRGPKYMYMPYGSQGINYADLIDPLRAYEIENNSYLGTFSDDGSTLLALTNDLSNWPRPQYPAHIFNDHVSNLVSGPGIYELNRLENGSFILGSFYKSHQSKIYMGFIQSIEGVNWIDGFFLNVTDYDFFEPGYNNYRFNFFEIDGNLKIFTSYSIYDIDGNGMTELGISIWNLERNNTLLELKRESNITFYEDFIAVRDDYATDMKHFLLERRNYTSDKHEGLILTYEDESWSQKVFTLKAQCGYKAHTRPDKLLIHNNQLQVIYSGYYGLNLDWWIQDNYYAHIGDLELEEDNYHMSLSKIRRIGIVDESNAICLVRDSISNKVILKDSPHKVSYPFDPPPKAGLAYYEEKYDLSQSTKYSFSFIAIVITSALPYRQFILLKIKEYRVKFLKYRSDRKNDSANSEHNKAGTKIL